MLLKSAHNLKKLKYDIKIVPVSMHYDRIFEASYLANEITSGKFQNTNLYDLMKKVFGMRKGKLGKVFVKFADPICLNDYIKLHQSNSDLPLKLTRDLYKIQQNEQPITMNSIIASSLLYYPRDEMRFKDVKISTSNIYDYIRDRGYKSYVSTSP